MHDLNILAAGRLVLRTWPLFLMRIAVYLGVAAAFVVAVGGGAGIGLGIGTLLGPSARAPGAFWGATGGFAALAALVWWLREYFLYFVEMAHACALAQSLEPAKGKSVQGPIGSAMTVLQRRFNDVRGLTDAERRVSETVGDLCSDLDPLGQILPSVIAPARGKLIAPQRIMFGFAAKSMLARAVRGKARNAYTDIRDQLILHSQNHEVLLRNAVFLAAVSLSVSTVAFFIALVPASGLIQPYVGGATLIAMLLAFVFAACFRLAVIEPLLIAAFVELSSRTAAGQEPDLGWDERLADISPSYREIKALAAPSIRTRRGVLA